MSLTLETAKTGHTPYPPTAHVRPLVVGAPLTDGFSCLAPSGWTISQVVEKLFLDFSFVESGWVFSRTIGHLIEKRENCNHWFIEKRGA